MLLLSMYDGLSGLDEDMSPSLWASGLDALMQRDRSIWARWGPFRERDREGWHWGQKRWVSHGVQELGLKVARFVICTQLCDCLVLCFSLRSFVTE